MVRRVFLCVVCRRPTPDIRLTPGSPYTQGLPSRDGGSGQAPGKDRVEFETRPRWEDRRLEGPKS